MSLALLSLIRGVAAMTDKNDRTLTPILLTNMRCRMRRAERILGIYLIINIMLSTCFEWIAYKYGVVEDHYVLLCNLFHFIICAACAVASVKACCDRALFPALIYAIVFILSVLPFAFHDYIVEFEINVKSRLFYAYPQLCQRIPLSGERASICYGYEVAVAGGDRETLAFNPGGEMSLPAHQWPEEMKSLFTKKLVTPEDDECIFRNTKRIYKNVYWINYDCWRKKS